MGIRKKRTTGNIVCILFTALPSVLAVLGCVKTEDTVAGNVEQEEQEVQIGLSSEPFAIERWMWERDASVSAAKELGAEINVQNANGDIEEQISQIEYFIKRQVDIIVAVARDCEALSDVVIRARGMGVKTVSHDRFVMNTGCDLYISFDNTEAGRSTARSILENIPGGGDIFLIQGPPTDNNASLVREGVGETSVSSNLNVVYEANRPGWIVGNAYTYMGEGLKLNRNAKGTIYGNNDLASQAFRALSGERLAGEMCMTGQDGDPAACQCIVEETQEMTAFKPAEQEASLAAECVVLLELGEEIEEVQDTAYDGTYNVPYSGLQLTAVTKENMDEVIVKGGFHAREDVHLGVN